MQVSQDRCCGHHADLKIRGTPIFFQAAIAACTRLQGPWWSKLRVPAAGKDVMAAARGGVGPALARRGAQSGSDRFRKFYSVLPVRAP